MYNRVIINWCKMMISDTKNKNSRFSTFNSLSRFYDVPDWDESIEKLKTLTEVYIYISMTIDWGPFI